MMVDLPDPEEPTSAVTVPGSAMKLMPCSTGFSGVVGKLHILKAHIALDGRHLHGAAGVWFSSSSAMISLVRSRPAKASVNCVPMFTI